jgi:hypothetical protein
MAITGHQTAKEVDRYTKGARQKKLAASAMKKWETGAERMTVPPWYLRLSRFH